MKYPSYLLLECLDTTRIYGIPKHIRIYPKSVMCRTIKLHGDVDVSIYEAYVLMAEEVHTLPKNLLSVEDAPGLKLFLEVIAATPENEVRNFREK